MKKQWITVIVVLMMIILSDQAQIVSAENVGNGSSVSQIKLGETIFVEGEVYYEFIPEKSGYFTFFGDCLTGKVYDENMILLAQNSGGDAGYRGSVELTHYFRKNIVYYLIFSSSTDISSIEYEGISAGNKIDVDTKGEDISSYFVVEPEVTGLYSFSTSHNSVYCDIYDISISKQMAFYQEKLVSELKAGHKYKIETNYGNSLDNIEPYSVQLDMLERTGTVWNGKVANGFSSGDGTERSPYGIRDASELAYLAKIVNEGDNVENTYFQLTNDISLNSIDNYDSWNQEMPQYQWIPIGLDEFAFCGIFEGNGHTISGLYMKSYYEKMGLFGVLSEKAWVKNINLENVYIENTNPTDDTYMGGIVAENYGKIIGCTCSEAFYGGVESKYVESDDVSNAVGVIAGINNGVLQECGNKCENVNYLIGNKSGHWGVNGGAGGIVGVTIGDIYKCFNECAIVATVADAYYGRGNQIGGIVGQIIDDGAVVNCSNSGNIRGSISYIYSRAKKSSVHMGGIAGSSEGKIVNCYNAGRLEIEDTSRSDRRNLGSNLGGIVGSLSYSSSWSTDENWIGRVYNSYNIGSLSNVELDTAYTGEIVGKASSKNSINFSYWLNNNNYCGGVEDVSINECSTFDNSQILENEILSVNNLCEVLNKWIVSGMEDVPYAELCVIWKVKDGENNGYPVLSDIIPEVPDSLSINTMPEKSEYIVNEDFDKKGLTLLVVFHNGKTEIVSEDDIIVDGYDFSEPGEGVVTVSYKNIKVSFLVQVKNQEHIHTYNTNIITASSIKNGIITNTCTKCGEKVTTTIYAAKTIKLSKTSFTYNGKTRKPSVIIKNSNGKTLKNKTDYTVFYPKSMKNVGKYTVTIKFKGNYSGTVKKTFTIVPKSTSISKVTPKKKGFTVEWKKQTTQTTGYEIAYSTDNKFSKKNTKVVTVGKNKTTSKSVSKLKAKKKYNVRIRTYKTVKGKKYYSGWSKVKIVTTKK